MTECELVLTNIRQTSSASRFFGLFKPKEPVNWEPFDLHLTFKNDSDQEFEGGKCKFIIRGELTENDHDVDIPPIKPKETKTITLPDLIIAEAGFHALTRMEIESKNGKKVSCKDVDDKDTGGMTRAYALIFATREELYQKYAVIVALFFSILASVLTIVNVIVTILK